MRGLRDSRDAPAPDPGGFARRLRRRVRVRLRSARGADPARDPPRAELHLGAPREQAALLAAGAAGARTRRLVAHGGGEAAYRLVALRRRRRPALGDVRDHARARLAVRRASLQPLLRPGASARSRAPVLLAGRDAPLSALAAVLRPRGRDE